MEKWRPILGFPDYEVSSLGRVRSWKIGGRGRSNPKTPRYLKPTSNGFGYLQVCLHTETGHKSCNIHTLVLENFCGVKPIGQGNYECRHLDGNKRNNLLSNLCWGTPAENATDRIRHGTSRAKLSEHEVREIRSADGTYQTISEKYSVGRNQIGRIKRYECWTHLK